MREAVLCFLKKDSSILLLTTQYPEKTVLNGVSGYIDEGETPHEAACREIAEEIGVAVEPNNLKSLGQHDIFHIFITELWSGEPSPQEPSILELDWFPIKNLPYDRMHAGNQDWLPQYITINKVN